MATQDRSSAYYLNRLERDHPDIHDDYKAGRHPSVRQAAAAAGLIRLPIPLTVLKREWKKASPRERSEFMAWATGSKRSAGRRSSRKLVTPIVNAEGRLLPTAKAQIEAIMNSRKIKMGVVMREMGFKPDNPSVGLALRGNRIKMAAVIVALERWIKDNKAHW